MMVNGRKDVTYGSLRFLLLLGLGRVAGFRSGGAFGLGSLAVGLCL
jgi:hypothetical protein